MEFLEIWMSGKPFMWEIFLLNCITINNYSCRSIPFNLKRDWPIKCFIFYWTTWKKSSLGIKKSKNNDRLLYDWKIVIYTFAWIN